MSRIGAAVIGLGVGEQHARAYAAHPGCAVRWLHDLHPARAEAVRQRLGAGAVAAEVAAVWADPGVHVVSIASFDDVHYGQVVEGLRAGKHLMVEKPLCRTVDELAAVKAAWLAASRPRLQSNLVLRGAPLWAWLKERIAAGELGEIYAFDGDYLYGRLHKLTGGWRREVADYSIMAGGGVHLVDLMIWLTGQRPDRVATVGNRLCTRGTAFRRDDFMAATFQFPSGLIGRITANGGCVHKHQHVVRLFGTRASFIFDDAGPRLFHQRDPGAPAERPPHSPLPAHKGVLIAPFVDAIVAGAETQAAADHEFTVIAALAAADRALDARREIEIAYV